jgi:hypothetical protein
VLWKCRLQNLLEVVNLWYLVEEVKPPTDPKDLAKYNKNAVNTKQILLDSVKDHLIPHITSKMYDALGTVY